MAARPVPLPLPSEVSQLRTRSIMRGLTAIAATAKLSNDPKEFVRRSWGEDREAVEIATSSEIKTRNASTITSTATPNVPMPTAVSTLINLLGNATCALSQIFPRAINLRFDSYGAMLLPTATVASDGVGFVGQGDPVPFKQLTIGGPTVTQQKLAAGFALTREQAEGSNGEAFITQAVRETLPGAIDKILLDDNEATSIRPVGVRNGVDGKTATSGGGLSALVSDLAMLGADVAGTSGVNICYVVSPTEFIKICALLPMFPLPVFPSCGVEDGSMICIGLPTLAVVSNDDPIKIQRSIEATIHFDDSSPQQLATSGEPLPFPVLNMLQVDAVAIRLVMPLTWALRGTSGCVSWTSSVTW